MGEEVAEVDQQRPLGELAQDVFLAGLQLAPLGRDAVDVDEAVKTLKNFLEDVYHKFQLPIWLTEYSLIRWTDPPTYPSWEQQAEFAAKSVEMLETLPFVERYAWYSLPPWTKDGSDAEIVMRPRTVALEGGMLPSHLGVPLDQVELAEGRTLTPDNAARVLLNQVYLDIEDPAMQNRFFALAAGAVTLTALLVLAGMAPAVMAGETVRASVPWIPALGLEMIRRQESRRLWRTPAP